MAKIVHYYEWLIGLSTYLCCHWHSRSTSTTVNRCHRKWVPGEISSPGGSGLRVFPYFLPPEITHARDPRVGAPPLGQNLRACANGSRQILTFQLNLRQRIYSEPLFLGVKGAIKAGCHQPVLNTAFNFPTSTTFQDYYTPRIILTSRTASTIF